MSSCACDLTLHCSEFSGDTAAASEGSCHLHFPSRSVPVAPNYAQRCRACQVFGSPLGEAGTMRLNPAPPRPVGRRLAASPRPRTLTGPSTL